jgi:hypothetical protein
VVVVVVVVAVVALGFRLGVAIVANGVGRLESE